MVSGTLILCFSDALCKCKKVDGQLNNPVLPKQHYIAETDLYSGQIPETVNQFQMENMSYNALVGF